MDELPVILAVGINDSKPEYLIKCKQINLNSSRPQFEQSI